MRSDQIPCEQCMILVMCRSRIKKEAGIIQCPILKEWLESIFNDEEHIQAWFKAREILKDPTLNVVVDSWNNKSVLMIKLAYRKGETWKRR
jgi:hypothetical protein